MCPAWVLTCQPARASKASSAAGADVKVLERMLGHASAALTLDRYGHLLPGQAESVAERLDQQARPAEPAPNAAVVSIESKRST